MKPEPVKVQRSGPGGKLIERTDRWGGMFAPINGKGLRPAYNCGPKDGHLDDSLILYQCPTSAIPTAIWQLLNLWWACRQTGLAPVAGGFLAQPHLVQVAFPIFEGNMQAVEASRNQGTAASAASAAVAAMAKAMGGG